VARRKPGLKTPQPPEPPAQPLEAIPTEPFKQDVALQEKRGKDLVKLEIVIESLRHRRRLDAKYRDHALGGQYRGWRDCHVEPDWLLIYKPEAAQLILGRTGSHSDVGIG
jgi:mRNA interferase YafQ